jgi:hypothetical protein
MIFFMNNYFFKKTMSLNIIENAIDCPLMDCNNISPLQLAWKRFCEEKSIMSYNQCDDNDFRIMELMKDPISAKGFPSTCNSFLYRQTFITEYCNETCKNQIFSYLLTNFDFKFFNASLIMSLYEPEDECCIDNDLCEIERHYDNYYGTENEDDYFYALKNATQLKLMLCCCGHKLIKLKDKLDKLDTIANQKPITNYYRYYERVWNRVFRLAENIGFEEDESDNEEDEVDNEEDEEDEYQNNLTIEQSETAEYLKEL